MATRPLSSEASSSAPRYQPDIDGLRAVAVLAVVWFHSGLAGVPGGYAGVDIFFVISGFLITRIVARELAAGEFSFARFFERRVRRIMPALVVVILATLIAGYALQLPDELESLGESALSSLGMVPNFYFWQDGRTGYFNLSRRISSPLLHSWSLGVEEQFYLLFPAFLLLARRIGKERLIVGLAALLSFALFLLVSRYVDPSLAFYMLSMRAWELGLGCLIALGAISVPAAMRAIASIAGLAMIVLAFVFLGVEGTSPAWLLVVPVLGAALLIASGENAPVAWLLSNPALVWIGRISYSLYLWHWPVFTFLRHWRLETVLPAAWATTGFAVSLMLAALTYYTIEQPARKKSLRFRKLLLWMGPAIAVSVAMAILAIASKGLPHRYDSQVLTLWAQSRDEAPLLVRCEAAALNEVEERCVIGTGSPQVAIWGDSHAAASSAGIAEGFGKPAVLLTMAGCPPLLEPASSPSNRCLDRNRAVADWLNRHPDIHTVVFVGRWPLEERKAARMFRRELQAAVSAVPEKQALVLAGVPAPGINVPWSSALHAARGRPPPQWKCPPANVAVTGAKVLDLSRAFCAHPRPWMLFIDFNHPSLTANREVIAPAIAQALSDGTLGQQAGDDE